MAVSGGGGGAMGVGQYTVTAFAHIFDCIDEKIKRTVYSSTFEAQTSG